MGQILQLLSRSHAESSDMRSVRPLNSRKSQPFEMFDQGSGTLPHSPLLQDLKMNLDEQRANSAEHAAHSSNDLKFVSLHVDLNHRRLAQLRKIVSPHHLHSLLGRSRVRS